MRFQTVLFFAAALAFSLGLGVLAADAPKPAAPAPAPPAPAPAPAAPAPPPAPAEPPAEAKARADFEAAVKAARDADAALGPLRTTMQAADTAFANATRTANAKRQQATDAKNLSGEPGVAELKQAEANVVAATTALKEATEAKPGADKALADAKTAAQPLQQAYEAAEKAAKEAEAAAKVAADAANKVDEDAKRAAAQMTAKRRAADNAKASLARAQQSEQAAGVQVTITTQKLAEAEAQKKAADAALVAAKGQPTEPAAKAQAAAAEQKFARATAQKKQAEGALAGAKSQITAAAQAADAAEKAAQDEAKAAEPIVQAAAQAAAKRKAVETANAALAQAQQGEQAAQAQVNAATQKLAEADAQKKAADAALVAAKGKPNEAAVQAQVNAAAQKLAEADAQKKAADAALAAAKTQVANTTAAVQAAREAGKDIIPLDDASRQAAANAAAKRKTANEAQAALAPLQQKLDQAAVAANSAAQRLTQAEARKKGSEEAVEGLKKRIESAKQTNVADEQAAKAAEDAAVPLKAEAERTRAAYFAAVKAADEKRALVEQAKTALYRLVAARQVASIMESPVAPKPANKIDEIVFAKLQSLNIQPVLCSDAVFVRRAYLDLTGKLPSADEAKAFIQNADPNKRIALIDRLLDQPAHFDYWAMRWGDVLRVKAEFPVKIWPNAAQAYHRWLWESVAQNKRYDQFARELLTSSGSNFRVGPANFYRAIQDRTPEGISGAVALAMMGTRIHLWPEDRRTGMAVFFSQVGYKPTSEWKEEIVFWDPLKSAAIPGNTAPGIDAVGKAVTATNQIPGALPQPLAENGPLQATFPDGTKITIPPNRDPREVFAEWLIRPENPWFARAIANRTWSWAMGRGIIHEPDDIRDNNPPSMPELLAYLQQELVSSGFDLKRLKRLIFTSTVYQFSPIARHKAPEARTCFAFYQMRRLEAEVLIDALNNITGSSDLYTSAVPEPFTYIPHDMSAVALADGSITSPFLTLFGRSARATGMEGERVNELASTQWLHTLNSATIQSKLQSGPRLATIISSGGKPNEIAERLYLTILSRLPTDADLRAVEEYAKLRPNAREMWTDLAWALINSPEFLLRH